MTDFDAYILTNIRPNHLGFGGLDRDNLNREIHHDPFAFLQQHIHQSVISPHWQLRGLFKGEAGQDTAPQAGFLAAQSVIDLLAPHRHLIYLGKRITEGHPEYFFTLDVSDMAEEALLSLIDMPCHFAELREVGPMVDGRDGSVLAYARAMLYWHGKHIYCGRCGQATSVEKLGHQRKCVSTNCGEMHFPRTDPAVIMLIEDGERVLLGRQAIWPEGMYSTLAGFVEPGETIEHATAREVFEEVGIQIGNIRYQHSQPWPFPSSLMLGLYATALTTELNINKDEIDHAQWFTREELLNFADQGKFLPRQLSISRRLIDDWLYQRHD
ncbi:MAG: NAD(+) diphosphatase [Candidatus Puniceispirillaceae bacterium]